ncbi:thiopeptide-type bacteriocin biosynthesis domain-containing protein [Mucilaginibacter mallensis]|uniref:Thiopeptide-type bacteriocin biosynthesis domain-containing protein n=1 Tax=Mucilaginibacter mallensis TaxID=652787 RepID=A0A1H1XZL2_MUCMA|nr:lantibiotic dehydratase [Mucilaginibacter mallensis]SDT14633.1 thiopeptide-type bacteriocin biosynthesis domain-containing protein [Mucilaginibacter mallensis]
MPNAICRTPAFSPADKLKDHWPALKEMIREASPAFFEVISELSYLQLSQANEKIQHTVWKYFNRTRYRATPFGSFAAISILPVSGGAIISPVILQRKPMIVKLTDWSEKDNLLDDLQGLVKASCLFRSNATYYQLGDEIRYIRNINGQFELVSVDSFEELTVILSLCSGQAETRQEICRLMHARFRLGTRSVNSLLLQLVNNQLLITERFPNITGDDYFTRLQLSAQGDRVYTLASRELQCGSFNLAPLKLIPEYIDFIKDFMPGNKSGHLGTFSREFTRKFDGKVISLALALDPEAGVGYGDMIQSPTKGEWSSLVESLQRQENSGVPFTFSAQHRFLLNAITKGGTIRLETFENKNSGSLYKLPNTFSVMCRYWQGHAIIENAGGCTANALLGRFTHGNSQVAQLGKEIAAIEERANPGILFFDVAYQAEKNVDNINRRKILYGAELPIVTWSCHTSAIILADICVTVKNGEVILWSERHKKRLVPRIASAYNYNRSDLAVYRFFCDLQHQGLRSDLNFNLRDFFPGLDHYPRVVYKNLIIAVAMWRVTIKIDNLMQLKKWLAQNNINFLFKCGHADQTLCFDPENEIDLEAFIQYCKQQTGQEIYISEALLNEADDVRDEGGKSYAAQYTAHYFHEKVIYETYPLATIPHETEVYFPGSEWLYFEIYAHPSRSDQILSRFISPFIAKNKKLLRNWFFIRYTDPGPHIRLRLKLKDVKAGHQLTHDLQNYLRPLCINGLIQDIQLKTYRPETTRYGVGRMHLVETFFGMDSTYIIRLISTVTTGKQLYQLSLALMNRLYTLAIPDDNKRLAVIKTVAEQFAIERGFVAADYKKINQSFEKLKKDMPEPKLSTGYEQAFCKIIDDCKERPEKLNMVTDLVHMHINRVFNADQRVHEAILYQYLLKMVKYGHFRAAAVPVF